MKYKGTKDSVCNDCYDDGFKGSPCPHIEVEELKKEWERQFDEKFAGYWRGQSIPDEIKFFINLLLAKQQEEFVKCIPEEKGMSAEGNDVISWAKTVGYNDCIADIKSKLNI
jgi:hypothetical protein